MSAPDHRVGEPLRERNGSDTQSDHAEIRKHVKLLLSDDYVERTDSISFLKQQGASAARATVELLTSRTLQPNAISTISSALEEIGKSAVEPLLDAIENFQELNTPETALLLETLIVTLGRIGDRKAAPVLQKQLPKINRAIQRNGNNRLVDTCEGARVRIHRILGKMGERGAADDLVKIMGDGRRRVRDGVIQTLQRIGDRRVVVPLLRLHQIEEGVTSAGAQLIRETVRDIMRRENLKPEDFPKLSDAERSTLLQVTRKKTG